MWKHLNKSQDGPCERTPTESESFQKGIRSQSNPVVLFYSSFSNWPVNITAFEVPEWHTHIKNFPNKSSLSASLKLQSFTNDGYVCNCTHHTPSGFSAIVWELFTGTYSTCFLLLSLWCSMPYLSLFSISLLLSPCINRPLRTLAWGGEERWTLHFQKQMQLCETCSRMLSEWTSRHHCVFQQLLSLCFL